MVQLINAFIIFLLSISGFSYNAKKEELPLADIALHVVIKKTAEQLKKKYQLSFIGVGGSGNDNEISMSAISFQLAQNMNQKECRQIILDCAQEFLEGVNSDPQLAPYLAVKPFGIKNIEIRIFISNPDGSDIRHPGISVVSLVDGVIKYATRDEKTHDYKSVINETYEEALQKVQSSDNS